MNETIVQLRTFLPAIWQYRWTALLVAIPTGLLAAFMAANVPNKFEASARVHVDTQSILQPLMKGLTVQPDLNQQIKMMARTLLSRPNIERVMKLADLDLKFVDPIKQDQFIKELQGSINFNSAGRSNLYSISYRSSSPESALRVVSSLLDVFVEKSIGDKRRDGDQARRFIDEQIATYEERLIRAEHALKEFKLNNLGKMPDSKQDYVGKSTVAQQELQTATSDLRQATSERDALRREVALESPQPGLPEDSLFNNVSAPTTDTDIRLSAALGQLDGLLIRYTENHPDVENVRFVIAALKKRKNAELREFAASQVNKAPSETRAVPSSRGASNAYNAIRASLAEAEARVAGLQSKVASARSKARAIINDAKSSTEVEAALVQLNRDYEINKKSFEELLARRESAQIASNLNKTTNLAEFRIIDPPRAEPKAVSPNRQILLMGALGISILVGLAVALLRSLIRPVFYDPDSIADITGHHTIGVISTVSGPLARFGQKLSLLGYSGLSISYVGLFVLAAWYLNKYGVPSELSNLNLPQPFNDLVSLL